MQTILSALVRTAFHFVHSLSGTLQYPLPILILFIRLIIKLNELYPILFFVIGINDPYPRMDALVFQRFAGKLPPLIYFRLMDAEHLPHAYQISAGQAVVFVKLLRTLIVSFSQKLHPRNILTRAPCENF